MGELIDKPILRWAGGKNWFLRDLHKRLASYLEELIKKRAFFVLTNAKHESVKKLFGSICSPISIERSNVIGGINAKRGIKEEYISTNTI